MVVSSVALFTSNRLGRFNENNPYVLGINSLLTTLIITNNFLRIDLYMGLGFGLLLNIIDI